jgi:hypothetical protein
MRKSLSDQFTASEIDKGNNYNLSQGIGDYDPDHPRFKDVLKRRVGVIDYVVLKAKSIFNPD